MVPLQPLPQMIPLSLSDGVRGLLETAFSAVFMVADAPMVTSSRFVSRC